MNLKNMDEDSKMELERMAARSLFDSANIDDDDCLSPVEMKKLLRQMLGKKKNREPSPSQDLISVNIFDATTKANRMKSHRELAKAETLIKKLGGGRNSETGRFELTKTQFVDAFLSGQLAWNGGLSLGFKDHVIKMQKAQRKLIFSAVVLFFLHYPVSLRIFQYFECEDIQGRQFLKQDYAVECFTSHAWIAGAPLVFLVLLGFTIAYPAAEAYILYSNRRALQNARIRQKWGFLYDR
jgi:hypothetical protein